MNYKKIEGLSLDFTQGEVVEKEPEGKKVGYAWTNVRNPIPKTPVGMNHRFFHNATNAPTASGKTVGRGHVKCLLHVVSRDGSASLRADRESTVGKFGASFLKGASVDFTMQCQATIGEVPQPSQGWNLAEKGTRVSPRRWTF